MTFGGSGGMATWRKTLKVPNQNQQRPKKKRGPQTNKKMSSIELHLIPGAAIPSLGEKFQMEKERRRRSSRSGSTASSSTSATAAAATGSTSATAATSRDQGYRSSNRQHQGYSCPALKPSRLVTRMYCLQECFSTVALPGEGGGNVAVHSATDTNFEQKGVNFRIYVAE